MPSFRVVCFTTIFALSLLGLSESSSRLLTPSKSKMTPMGNQGYENTKIEVQIPASALNGNPNAKGLGEKLARDIVNKLSATSLAVTNVPFPGMSDWQKYTTLALKEYMKSRENDEDYKNDCLWELQDMMGELYDEMLEEAVTDDNNAILNPRQEKFLELVKEYFKLSFEKFIGVKLKIPETTNPNKIIKKKLLESFDDDKMYNRKKKMTVGNIVKEDIPMEEPIEIECELTEDDAIDDAKLWKPEGQLKAFIKEYSIPIFSQPPKAAVDKIENNVYFCTSPEDETSADFYVHETRVQFVKTTATKSRRSKSSEEENSEYPEFSYFQTYLGDDRVHISDIQRLTFEFKGGDEEGGSEEAAASGQDED